MRLTQLGARTGSAPWPTIAHVPARPTSWQRAGSTKGAPVIGGADEDVFRPRRSEMTSNVLEGDFELPVAVEGRDVASTDNLWYRLLEAGVYAAHACSDQWACPGEPEQNDFVHATVPVAPCPATEIPPGE